MPNDPGLRFACPGLIAAARLAFNCFTAPEGAGCSSRICVRMRTREITRSHTVAVQIAAEQGED
jgi:hypothetical protein